MQDLIQLAREMGHAVQQQDFYQKLRTAQANADADLTLQALIAAFTEKRDAINAEACKEDRDDETLRALNDDLRTAYAEIMKNEHMIAYNTAKQEFDHVMQRVLAIITQSAQGEDPDTTDYSESCTHDCSTCGGCH